MADEKDDVQKQVDAHLEKMGMKPVDLSKTEQWIGDTRRSDFEEYKRIKEAEEKYETMKDMATAGDISDVHAIHDKLTTEKKDDPVMDYMDSKLPKEDTWQKYPEPTDETEEPEQIEETDSIEESEPMEEPESVEEPEIIEEAEPVEEPEIIEEAEPVEESLPEKFEQNKDDVLDTPESPDRMDEFNENAQDLDVYTEPPSEILKDDFNENAGDITGEKF